MPYLGNDRTSVKKKLAYSNSFLNHQDDISDKPFRRDIELRHSVGSAKGQYGVSARAQTVIKVKYPIKGFVQGSQLMHNSERAMQSDNRRCSSESPMSDTEEQGTTPRSVSHLIKGFESKNECHTHIESNSLLSPGYGSYGDNLDFETVDRNKRNSSKRKLSLRKKGKNSSSNNVTVLQKLGIAPFMGSENRNAKKSLAHFDVQSVLFDLESATTLKTVYADGGNRPRNISTGASAASTRNLSKKADAAGLSQEENSKKDDEGDGTSNDLVENCPYFRNEIGHVDNSNGDSRERLLDKLNNSVSSRLWTPISKNRSPSLELLHTTDNDIGSYFSSSTDINGIDQKKNISLLESVEDDSKIALWDRPKSANEKRIFEFEHVDLGALYYKNYFIGKDHQNFMGIDEKYGPIGISLIRESIEKMAVLGHTKDWAKCRVAKYQYRIILRTTDLRTFRGTVLEDSIPSTTRHGTSKPLPARDVLEFCFPELQTSCLKTSIIGPKVPEHLQKLDEQQLSLQFKVGLLYCKAGQKSEEDMYNNEHHGPAFEEFMELIGEKVLLKGFDGYRAQLDNKNDSTGIYSLYTKFQNREIMFHVSTLLPLTPSNKQQLLRKRHIGNDIVTVIFQEPGAEPFSPQNIRSHFQHVFIIVRVEKSNSSSDTTYRVAVSRSQDVPTFGPPVPPDSSFRKDKAFRNFLLSKIINAENAAHKSQKFATMALRTRYEYLKDLATSFVTAQGIDTNVPKFSKFNPMSLSVKKREKIHPPCSPEVWCQAGLVWSVKVEVENLANSSHSLMVISTQVIALVDTGSKEVLAAIPCKSLIGWRNSGYSMRLYYNNGKGLNLTLLEDDGNEMIFIINRLKAVTPGCQTQDMSLRRSRNGQLGFHVFYEGLVAEVEPYGMAWQAGLRKGSRLLEINNRLVGSMSHDRMIQALRKPGNTRVVVLPPLPDGQPRNYKSTRNLKRFSSMTSVYSERLLDSSETSSSTSSFEKVPTDVPNSIRVGGQKMTVVTATVTQPTPASKLRQNKHHIARPYGIVLDSDQSLELTEASSGDNLFSSMSAAEVNGFDRRVGSKGTPGSAISSTPIVNKKPLDAVTPKVPSRIVDPNNLPTSVSIDVELTELEKTLTNTRKSIDAKFYRSLMQNSSNLGESTDGAQFVVENSGQNANLEDSQNRTSPEFGRTPPCKKTLSKDSQYHITMVADSKSFSHKCDESGKELPGNRRKVLSPPPYEEAVTSLKRHRSKKSSSNERSKTTTSHKKESPSPMHRDQFSPITVTNHDASTEEKPRCLMRTSSSDRRKIRSAVKSENLEDLLGKMYPQDNTPIHAVRAPPYEFIGNRNKLMAARSESNIPSSYDSEVLYSGGASIVHTRVRDVDDIINEKIHVRSGSADQLNGFATVLRTPIRPPSATETEVAESLKDTPKKFVVKSNRQATTNGFLSSNQDESSIASGENVALVQNTGHHVTTHHPPNREDSMTRQFSNHTEELDNLNDTFAKIDQAFGFTSYISEQLNRNIRTDTNCTPFRYRQKSITSSFARSTSADDSSSSTSHPVNLNAKGAFVSFRDKIKARPEDSTEKKKSEAEESLEAAITDFHSTLSNLPEKRYPNILDQSEELSPLFNQRFTPSMNSFPKTKLRDQRTAAKSFDNKTDILRNDDKERAKSKMQISRKVISYPDGKERFASSSATRQSLHLPYSYKGNGSRVQELVGKFSQNFERKNSLDSSLPRKTSDRIRSRSEAKISASSSSSFIPKDYNPIGGKSSEANRVFDRYKKHMDNSYGKIEHATEQQTAETPARKKISVTVRPKLDFDSASHHHVTLNSPPVDNNSFGKMTALPERSKNFPRTLNKNVVDVPLSVRGLDLAPQRTEDLRSSSKEDLRLMLSVLSGELIKEKGQNERLLEELELARFEKDQLMEQSKRSASQLRKFTSWFYDSIQCKENGTES